MNSQDVKKYKLPDKPGVYFFKRGKSLLYVGKATSLKDRVRSYFVGDIGPAFAEGSGVAKRGPKIWRMVEIADKVEWQETDSVLEALLLETELIKKHQPKYNSREKDDKSYWYVIITDEDFPRVLLVRGQELKYPYCAISNLAQFGPFPYASEIKEALKIIRKIFPFRDKCLPCRSGGESSSEPRLPCVTKHCGQAEVSPRDRCRSCFNRQIGLCPGVCTGEISKTDYRKIVRNIKLLFSGKKQEILKSLEKEMKNLSKKREFEKAGQVRDQIFALNHIRDVSLLKGARGLTSNSPEERPRTQIMTHSIRIEAYDIAHLSGTNTAGAMVVWQDGEMDKSKYKKFKLKGSKAKQVDDLANLREILERRLAHTEWPYPDVIVVDGNQVQVNVADSVVRNRTALNRAQIIAVTKNDRHKVGKLIGDSAIIRDYRKAIILANSEAHRFALFYHRKLRGRLL